MDQQLKQRLIGVTIVVALVVIFVPMLFEKSDDKGRFSSTGIPSIPDDVMEKSIELPKTAEDIAPTEEEKKPVESGYRIVPLNEEPPPKPKPVDGSGAKASPEKELGEEDEPVAPKEEGKPSTVKSGKKAKQEMQPAATARTAPLQAPDLHKPESTVKRLVPPNLAPAQKKTKPVASKPLRSTEPDDDFNVRDEPVPSPVRTQSTQAKKPKSTSVTSPKPGDDATRKPVATQKPATAKTPGTLQPKPKTSAPLPEADRNLDDEAIPVPAKPETPLAKPKSSMSPHTRPKGVPAIAQERIKPPNAVKPSEAEHPASKMDRLNSSPADANPQQLKPKAIKPAPAPVKPAKPADPEKIKPQTMAPGGWAATFYPYHCQALA